MFVRKVASRNSICFQVGRKQRGRFILIKHIGCARASAEPEVAALQIKAQAELSRIRLENQPSLFLLETPPSLPSKAVLLSWRITGFHRVFGKVYDAIGFPAGLLRDLVIGRIVHPKSKLATLCWFDRFLGIRLAKDAVYRFLDTLDKDQIVAAALSFVSHRNQGIRLIFYDVTTLHFETETEDQLRRRGYAKNHRHDLPQILVGLFVDRDGYPFDFDFFPGDTFEGHTLETAIDGLIRRYRFDDLTVVADAAMLSKDNLAFLDSRRINYVVGARLKSLPASLIQEIIAHDVKTAGIYQSNLENKRLMVDFSPQRAQRDQANREKLVRKLELKLTLKRPVVYKSKYLQMETAGKAAGIDRDKVAADEQFDGLKGYFTNAASPLSPPEAISQYRYLWRVEKAFRMSKNDLKERPIYHWSQKRIKAHLVVCFAGLLVMRETERILGSRRFSLEKTIEILGRVGQGKTRVGRTILELESEPDQETKSILDLFEGH